jgi:autotransporter-associated beta strand protein
MKIRPNPFLKILALAAITLGQTARADIFDTNGTTAGFGVTNGSTYDWWGTGLWSDGTAAANDEGTAATVTWQGASANEQAYFIGSGTAGENYTVRLGATGATDASIQNLALNVNAAGNAALTGAAGNVTIGEIGDTGRVTLRAANSVGVQNAATLTINNGVNLNAFTLNFRGGNLIINGLVSGTGTSKIAFGGSALGFTSGPGTLTLANPANTYTGRANSDFINTGFTLAVTKLADGGSASSIGTSSAKIGINGGTLRYLGNSGAQSTNLGFNIGSAHAFINASGVMAADTISFTGAPTYSATNSARNITLTGDNLGDNTMGFAFSNNGSGVNILNKTGAGRWIVNQANGHTGGTNANGGTLVAANTAAFGIAGRTINLSTGTVDFATDTTANAYVLNVGSGNTGTVVVNRASAAADMTHTMGIATLGNGTLNIQKGANVTGSGTLEFPGIAMTAGATGFSSGTMLNPTSANVFVNGPITRSGGSANLLTLAGTSAGNRISGVISGPQALTKSNISTWEISNANTYTGRTLITGGTLKLTNNLAIQNSAFDTSSTGTLDLTDTTINTLTIGGLIGSNDFILPANVTSLTFNPASGATHNYFGQFSGGTDLVIAKSGPGTQILSNTSTHTGDIAINGGGLQMNDPGALGSGAVITTSAINNSALMLNNVITGSGKSLVINGPGVGGFYGALSTPVTTNISSEWQGSVTIGATTGVRIGSQSGLLNVSGNIGEATPGSSLIIRNADNAGTTLLTGNNSYTGGTSLFKGFLQLGSTNAIGTGGGTLTFGGGFLSSDSFVPRTIPHPVVFTFNATLGSASNNGALTFTNTIDLGTSVKTLTLASDAQFDGVISGGLDVITGALGGITKAGAGTLTITNAANSYTGVTTFQTGITNAAVLSDYGVDGSLGNRAAASEVPANIGIHFTGGTLQHTGSTAQSTNRAIRIGTAGGTIDASGSIPEATMNFTKSSANVDFFNNPGARTLTLTGSNTGDNRFALNIQDQATTARTSLNKSGSGTWLLTNANNSADFNSTTNTFGGYGGGTTIADGTLAFTQGAIGGGVVNFTGNSTLRWEPGNTQDITTGSGSGVARSVRISDNANATFDTNGNDVTLSNALAVGSLATGSITKSGTGNLTLSGTNTYTGGTTVDNGTLTLTNAFLDDASTLAIASNAVLNLTHTLADVVDALVIDGSPLPNGLYNASTPATAGRITGTGSIQVGPPSDPFLAWINSTWPTLSNQTPTADPDNDGIPNLLEYILQGGDPSTASSNILPTLNASGANFVFTYFRRTAATGTTQTFEFGNNLNGWTPIAIPSGNGVTLTDLGGGIEKVEITIPKGTETRLFGRLQVTTP